MRKVIVLILLLATPAFADPNAFLEKWGRSPRSDGEVRTGIETVQLQAIFYYKNEYEKARGRPCAWISYHLTMMGMPHYMFAVEMRGKIPKVVWVNQQHKKYSPEMEV